MRHVLVVADVAPVVDLLVDEQVADDQDLAVRQLVGAGVAQTEPAVVVVEEGQQLGGGVEPGEGVWASLPGSKCSTCATRLSMTSFSWIWQR